MHGHGWEFDLVAFPIIRQINVGSELLGHKETLAAELNVCFLVGLVDIVAFTALAVAGSHRRMVRHLLS